MNNHHLSRFRRFLAHHHPSAFLLAAQLLSLVLYVLFEGSTGGRALLGGFGLLVLVLVIWVIQRSPDIRWFTWILVIPAFLLSLLSVIFSNATLLAVSSLIEAVVYFYAVGRLISYMMEDRRVTTDELFAAGATFTLLAWGFAYAYQACQIWLPGSFSGAVNPEQPRTFLELLSLSFTNLSATGSGDIMALSSPGRVLVMLEQFAGVGYVAVVVSRLIGMTLASQKARREP